MGVLLRNKMAEDPEKIAALLANEDVANELKARTNVHLTELLEDDG